MIYHSRVSASIPVSKEIDPLLEIDRNVRKLEIFLANHKPPLSVGDLRKFLPCTINVDPYLRKLIRGEWAGFLLTHWGLSIDEKFCVYDWNFIEAW